ncbi:MAG: hypothetical protein FWE46_06090 [Coriobacteriia bacterium]|nr:hypothetical protein [Coriobacteriia bacterium]
MNRWNRVNKERSPHPTLRSALVIALMAIILMTGYTGSGSAAYAASVESTATVMSKHEKMVDMDRNFNNLSKKQRAQFIRYWFDYYEAELGSTKLNADKAVAIANYETSLGKAGVGKAKKKNLFGCKIDQNGKFVSSFPRFKNYRSSVKAIVVYYHMHPQGLSAWNRLGGSTLGK